ncbi:CobW family GTP-binding protein [Gordonia pseudamarae]|uniref:CobW family GTP-binding protein n=1 Tax=Gordonia pseudamarae TaxID=2831662 RepID=UPI00389920BB
MRAGGHRGRPRELVSVRRHREAIPVVIVAGFLGAGKTTLLNALLANPVGARLGVIVNDFGAINIDALLVAGQSAGTISFGNGCLCCSVDADGLGQALAGLADPAAGLDAIVVEASGIAEPRALIKMIAGIADRAIRYGGLVYVVDVAAVTATVRRHPEIGGHIAIADLVVVNKADLVDGETLAEVLAKVAELNPTAPRVVTSDGRIDCTALFDPAPRPDDDADVPRQLTLDELLRGEGPECGHGGHLHEQFNSVSVQVPGVLDPRRLAQVLERPPTGCYRIKGVVWLAGADEQFGVHAVGGFVRTERTGSRRLPAAPGSSLVVIGTGLDEARVRALLEGLVAAPDLDDEFGILGIMRHLPAASQLPND